MEDGRGKMEDVELISDLIESLSFAKTADFHDIVYPVSVPIGIGKVQIVH
jgi:hypothetical protein